MARGVAAPLSWELASAISPSSFDLGWPTKVSSTGGILVQKEARSNISDTQTAAFDFPQFPVTWTHRTWGDSADREYPWGATIYGEKGTLKLSVNKYEFFLALLVLFTALGALVESLGMIVITVPLLYPLLAQYGIDPVWFGIIVVLFIEMGQITPPIGINLFVIQGISRGSLSDVVLGTVPFHLLMFLLLAMLVVWPELALWLPSHVSGS